MKCDSGASDTQPAALVILTDERLCQAIVDRLTFEAHIIETGTQSFRLAGTTAKRQAAVAAT